MPFLVFFNPPGCLVEILPRCIGVGLALLTGTVVCLLAAPLGQIADSRITVLLPYAN